MTTTTLDQKCIREAEMDVIRDFVYQFREQRNENVAPFVMPYAKMSTSGEHSGEGFVTLYQGLIPVTEGYGVWKSLEDDEIRHMVLKQVVRDQYVLRR